MLKLIKLFSLTFISFILIDMVWLGFIAKNLYSEQLGSLMRKTGDALAPNWYAAIAVYLLFAAGVLLFVLPRANGNLLTAFCFGAVFGLVIYGIYDFTNYALLANWPLKITLIDLLWGSFLCGIVSFIASYLQGILK